MCDLVLPFVSLMLSSTCLRLLPRLPISYTLSCIISFSNVFQGAVSVQDVATPISLIPFYCTYDIPVLLDCKL